MKTKHIIVTIVVLLVCSLAVFGVVSDKPDSKEVVKIGAALGLTGECANYGEEELRAARLAIDEANKRGGIAGKQIVLVIEDIQYSPKGAINAMRKLIDVEKVEAIVGLTWGDSFQAGYSINNQAKVVAVAPSTAMEALTFNNMSTEYVFSTWFSERDEINALQGQARKMGIKKIVLFHDEDAFATMMAHIWRESAERNGLITINEYKVPVGYDDYRTIILKMKNDNPEGVVFFAQTQATRAQFMKEAKELGLNAVIFQSADIENLSLLNNYAGAMEGIIYTFPEVTGEQDDFKARFKEAYGKESIGASDAAAYDATRVIIAGLEEHYKTNKPLKEVIEHIAIPGTAYKEIKFNTNHQISSSTYLIKTVKNGEFVELE